MKTDTRVRKMAVVAMLSAVSFILMFLQFPVPLMPSFIQMDFSELPALIAAFSVGPIGGVAVSLIKNLLHLPLTTTGGVGELSNFILSVSFVLPAGILYRYKKGRSVAIIGAIIGAVLMAAISVPSNYFIVYPFYYNFMPQETVLAAYQAINPNIHNIMEALLIFNMPFTFIKGMVNVIITILIYKRISPILKGTRD